MAALLSAVASALAVLVAWNFSVGVASGDVSREAEGDLGSGDVSRETKGGLVSVRGEHRLRTAFLRAALFDLGALYRAEFGDHSWFWGGLPRGRFS